MINDDAAELLKHTTTEKQKGIIQYFVDHPEASCQEAGEANGVSKSTVTSLLSKLRRRRAHREVDAHHDVAPGTRVVKVTTHHDSEGNVKNTWTRTVPDYHVHTMDSIRAELETMDFPAIPAVPTPENTHEDLLCVYPWGDPHLGLRSWRHEAGEDYDLAIAKTNLLRSMTDLINLAPPADTCVIAPLGDTFHANDARNVTPKSGHILDVDTRYELVMRTGFYIVRNCIQLALQKHKNVHVVVVRGNHDPQASLVLKIVLEMLFENEPRVTFNTGSQWFDYYSFGNIRLGFHHGHGKKMADLPLHMTTDPEANWESSRNLRGWIYTGHIHHEVRKEYEGIVVESVNTLAAKDGYSAEHGYRSRRCAFVDTFHRTRGQISRMNWDLLAETR